MLTFPNIDPVMFSIGPLVVRWYAVAYLVGILGGWQYLCYMNERYNQKSPVTKKHLDDLLMWITIGVVLGGRIGYVLFYNLTYYINHPGSILQVWQGGMSFHGGLLGVLIAMLLFGHFRRLKFLDIADLAAIATPIGLFFGRLANFINGELFGRITDAPWGMVFPRGGQYPRHPSQLYEAGLEGLLLFVVLWWLVAKREALSKSGLTGGVFLLGYGLARFLVEFVRQPDEQLGFVFGFLSMGQVLCLPMILFGLGLIHYARHHQR